MSEMNNRKSVEKCEKPEPAKKSKNEIDHKITTDTAAVDQLFQPLQKEINQLQAKYNEKEKAYSLLSQRLESRVKSYDRLKARHDEFRDLCDAMKDPYASLEQDYGSSMVSYKSEQAKCQALEQKHKSLETTNKTLSAQAISQKSEIKQLKAELAKEKRRSIYYKGEDIKLISEMLATTREWTKKFEKMDFEANVAFIEMNKYREMEGVGEIDREGFDEIIDEYR
ncbi:hypothetical protein L486_05899 [Kwoniella mangroviensis CBS 10435]|uniref:Uncharacterized protein n=1 Tax=Kwoniella mangroviensis CBS 10435 TaxID=1331196 RepID=A0A1B9IN96_9TREE|nr:hypothetical protein L486_05899 [Kwoniella mangroviensis CBS 10435]